MLWLLQNEEREQRVHRGSLWCSAFLFQLIVQFIFQAVNILRNCIHSVKYWRISAILTAWTDEFFLCNSQAHFFHMLNVFTLLYQIILQCCAHTPLGILRAPVSINKALELYSVVWGGGAFGLQCQTKVNSEELLHWIENRWDVTEMSRTMVAPSVPTYPLQLSRFWLGLSRCQEIWDTFRSPKY